MKHHFYSNVLQYDRGGDMKDYAIISYAYDKQVRIYAAQSTMLVEKARSLHHTWPTSTAALGRVLTVSAMMGLTYKEGERITVRIKGDGPIGPITVEADGSGEVRGEIANPEVYLKYNSGPKAGKLNVGAGIGKGFLFVTKDLNMKQYFTSSSELQTGEIGDDFTYYFALSDQIPSSVGAGVLVDIDQHVLAAGGYILQLMPGCSEDVISKIETMIETFPPISSLIEQGKTPEDIIHLLANGTEEILEKKPIAYVCHCSKERFARSLATLDDQTLDMMIHEDEQAEVECHFCHHKYHYTKEELIQIKKQRK